MLAHAWNRERPTFVFQRVVCRVESVDFAAGRIEVHSRHNAGIADGGAGKEGDLRQGRGERRVGRSASVLERFEPGVNGKRIRGSGDHTARSRSAWDWLAENALKRQVGIQSWRLLLSRGSRAHHLDKNPVWIVKLGRAGYLGCL